MSSPFSQFQKRIFLCHGQVRDRFAPPHGVPLEFDQFLHQHLRSLGYEIMVYYNHTGLYFYDPISRDWIIEGKSTASPPTVPTGQPTRPSLLAPAPGGLSLRQRANRPVAQGTPAPSGQPARMCYPNLNRLTEILPHLRRLTAPGSPHAAIIFDSDHLGDFSAHGSTVEQFRGFLDKDIHRLPATSKTILVFLFGMPLSPLLDHLRDKPALKLLLSQNQNHDLQGMAQRIQVGSPDRDEVARLIHYYRLMRGLPVDWRTLEKNVLRLTAMLKGEDASDRSVSAAIPSGRTLKDLEHHLNPLAEAGRTLDAAAVRTMTGQQVSERSALERLDAMIGLDHFKDFIRKTRKSWQFQQAQSKPPIAPIDDVLRFAASISRQGAGHFLHLVLKGNPGTGKTTVAQLIGEIYQEAGLLEIGHTIKTGRHDLVAGYVGQTAIKTQERIEQARGGVLFIDEAYSLVEGGDNDFGREAITTLIKAMDDDKDNLCVIFAGYPDDMDRLMAANAGFERRVKTIVLDDYHPEQLAAIFADCCRRAHPPVVCDAELTALLPRFFQEMYDQRGKDFGNAGTINTLFDDMRKALHDELDTPADSYTLSQRHLPARYQHYLTQIEAADRGGPLEELEALAGLAGVKTRIRDLIDDKALNQARQAQGLAQEPVRPGHYLFLGNPGTGKTTVARLMGAQFKRMGLLKTARLVEMTASQLSGQQYLGHAEKAVHDQVKEALGGILFIDEAHQLAQDRGFGHNALTALTPLLTNHAHELTVICAGYTDQMQALFNIDPGLKRRFEIIEFADFTADELTAAFNRFVRQAGFTCSPDAQPALQRLFTWMVENKTLAFGNAGAAEKVFERARRHLAQRVKPNAATEVEAINTILAKDIPQTADCGDLL